MKWTKEEKLKMVLEYKKNGFTPFVKDCSKEMMYKPHEDVGESL